MLYNELFQYVLRFLPYNAVSEVYQPSSQFLTMRLMQQTPKVYFFCSIVTLLILPLNFEEVP